MKIFEKWLLNRINERTARTYINYLNKYLTNVCSAKDLQELLLKINNCRNWFIKAVRNLLNFAEEREDLNDEFIMKLRKVLKIKQSGVREVFISDEELIEAYKNIKNEVKPVLKLLAFSGVRLSHAFPFKC